MNLDIVFVSDLHLGTTPAAEGEPYVGGFARFLDHVLDRSSAEGHACRLVLLGDALDFLKVRLPAATGRRCSESSMGSAIVKLEKIARQEPLFFAALGRFAAAGLPIDVVAGNHDIDLVRSAVQQRFQQLVDELSGCSQMRQQIRFHPWIYHVPGIVYAEHGQQYHDINSFATVLRPYLPGDEDRVDHPLAAHLSRIPGATSPFARFRGKAIAGMSALRQAVELTSRERANRRMDYREQVLRPYAAQVSLDYAAVVAIDELSEVSLGSIAVRLLRKVLRGQEGTPCPTQQGGYLHGAALAIHRILAPVGATVPCYVFGHAHIAERFPLEAAASSPEYLNTGTWSPHLPAGVARRHGLPLLTFVQIRARYGETPVGEVLVWDDRAGAVRPLDVG